MAIYVLQAMLGIAFLMSGIAKLSGARMHANNFRKWGFSPNVRHLVGGAEVVGGVGMLAGIWIPVLAVLAGLGLAALMVGALGVHRRAKDPFSQWAPAFVFLLVAASVAVRHASDWFS